jgi:hypothetical protein
MSARFKLAAALVAAMSLGTVAGNLIVWWQS